MKRILALILATLLTFGASVAYAAQKNEIVYVTLSSDGSVDEVFVVNRFDSDISEHVTDYGEYYAVYNLTDMSPLDYASDFVSFTKPEGAFFYQGDPASKTLPWTFSITYRLNGEYLSAQALAGRSGRLEIGLDIERGASSYDAFFEHYLLSLSITLDGDLYKNIEAEKATAGNSGKDTLLAYTIMPDTESHFDIAADVLNFEMSDITISAVPMGMDIGDIDTTEIMDKISQLQSGIRKVNKGASSLAGGASGLAKGTNSLVAGAKDFSSGLDTLASGATGLAKVSSALPAAIEKIGGSVSVSKLRGICGDMEQTLDDLQSKLDGFEGTRKALNEDTAALRKQAESISEDKDSLMVSQGDIDILRTLQKRGLNNADVSKYLSAELAAMGRVLTTTSNINDKLDALRSQAAAVSGDAAALSDKISGFITDVAPLAATVRSALKTLDNLLEDAAGDTGNQAKEAALALAREIDKNIQALDQGIGGLQTGFASVYAGMKDVNDGAQALLSGVGSLEKGTGTLKKRTEKMDEQMTDGVDEAIETFTGGDFEPISFMDGRNPVKMVQFVVRLPGIKIPDEPDAETDVQSEEPEAGFWEKLMRLFKP